MIFEWMSSSAWAAAASVSHMALWACGRERRSRAHFAHLHVLKAILLSYAAQHVLFAALLHLASEQQLVKDEVGLLEVEDDVELAYVAVVLVHLLDIAMDDLEGDQLIVGRVASGDEEERGVAAIYDLGVWQIV